MPVDPEVQSEKSAGHTAALQALLGILDLEELDNDQYRGVSLFEDWNRVYGGQVLAQALVAAIRTVHKDRLVHSLHGYFLLGGDPKNPITYHVDRARDGTSFSTRHVRAVQHGRTIFIMSASFHKAEEGYDHQSEMPDVPPPEKLKSASDLFAMVIDRLPENMRRYWSRPQPIEMRPIDLSRYLKREKREPKQNFWMKAAGSLPDDLRIHQALLAYVSDFTLLDTALIAHAKLLFDSDIQLASLDHAMWFHRPCRLDDWLLYAEDSPSAYGARGFCRGQIFTRDGKLAASTAQEGLTRPRSTDYVLK